MPEESANNPVVNPPTNTSSLLDRNVPNPMAKNPNFFTHKVVAAVGLILIGTIITASGIWWYVENQSGTKTTDDTTTKVSTSSAKKDDTGNWQTLEDLSNVDTLGSIKFSFSYPEQFRVLKDNVYGGGDSVTNNPTDDTLRGLKSGYTAVFGRIYNDPMTESYNSRTFDDKLGSSSAYIINSDSGMSMSRIYYVKDAKNSEGSEVPFSFVCNYNYEGIKDTTELVKTCDLIASTFKFL